MPLVIPIIVLSLNYTHHMTILHFLRNNNCSAELYQSIYHIKNKYLTERPRIECSTKNGTTGRYVMPILLSEFQAYTHAEQCNILNTIGFTFQHYTHFIKSHQHQVTPSTDIILGMSPQIGKVYLDFDSLDGLVCLEKYFDREFPHRVKYYRPPNDSAANDAINHLLVTDNKGTDLGYHQRQTGWVGAWNGYLPNGTLQTTYHRPSLYGISLVDICALLLQLCTRSAYSQR